MSPLKFGVNPTIGKGDPIHRQSFQSGPLSWISQLGSTPPSCLSLVGPLSWIKRPKIVFRTNGTFPLSSAPPYSDKRQNKTTKNTPMTFKRINTENTSNPIRRHSSGHVARTIEPERKRGDAHLTACELPLLKAGFAERSVKVRQLSSPQSSRRIEQNGSFDQLLNILCLARKNRFQQIGILLFQRLSAPLGRW